MLKCFDIKIHGSRRVLASTRTPFAFDRGIKLKRFSRQFLPLLNCWFDFHYNDGNEAAINDFVCALKQLGEYLRLRGVIHPQRKADTFFLPLSLLECKKTGTKKILANHPNIIYVAARGDKSPPVELSSEMIRFLTARANDEWRTLTTIGICDVSAFDIGLGKKVMPWAFNIALTQYLAREICRQLRVEDLRCEYPTLNDGVEILSEKIGFDAIFQALFSNDISLIIGSLNKIGLTDVDEVLDRVMLAADLELNELCEEGRTGISRRDRQLSRVGRFKECMGAYLHSI